MRENAEFIHHVVTPNNIRVFRAGFDGRGWVFGGFAAPELAARIDDALPKVILSASCGVEGQRVIPYRPLLDQAIVLAAHKPGATMVLQRPMLAAPLTPVTGTGLGWTVAAAVLPS